MRRIPLDKLQDMAGQQTGRSHWLTVDQSRIDRFAQATGNRHWLHTDPERASRGPFGTTIAHGFLTLSLLDGLLDEAALMPEGAEIYINYGSDKVRYLAPVPAGSRIRAVSTLVEITDKAPGQLLLKNHVVVEIEGDERPALVGDVLYLAFLGEAR